MFPRLLSPILVLGAGLALGCSNTEPSASAPVLVLAPKSAPAQAVETVRYGDVKVTCCTNGRVNRVLDRGLDLHQALVREEGISEAMDALASAARDAEKEGALEPDSLAAVMAIAAAAEAAKSGGLIEQRQALLLVGGQLKILIPAHAGGGRDLAQAVDPETDEIWYQREGKAANPFGGSQARFSD